MFLLPLSVRCIFYFFAYTISYEVTGKNMEKLPVTTDAGKVIFYAIQPIFNKKTAKLPHWFEAWQPLR
jgi:hypothetical protein